MRSFRAALLAGFLVLFTHFALAETILPPDPSIIIRGATGDSTSVGLSFTFQADPEGLGFLSFVNASGQDWFRLDIVTTPPFTPGDPCFPIAHSSDVFASSSCSSMGGGQVLLSFFGIVNEGIFPGILSGSHFTIDLGSDPLLAWTPNEQFDATANVPEPATVVLFLTGAGMMAARRRFRKGLHSRV
ncbi:MAG TPA: PEP-CTERM sorting domain-containing protein [Candidatus Acidoferrales bacterium]